MDSILQNIVIERLQGSTGVDVDAQCYVLLALDGAGPLEEALAGKAAVPAPKIAKVEPEIPKPGAFLRSISVEGFRGIGSPRTLELHPGPGLTLVIGRNGSGKSSFAEGLEMLLTGNSKRWSDRSAVVWKEGWRNLHHPTCAVGAEFILQGESGALRASRSWQNDSGLTESEVVIQRHGQKKEPLEALGWTDALESYRPFLSYNELGSMFDKGPTSLYGAVGKILGLEDLVAAEDALKEAHKIRKKSLEAAKTALAPLMGRLNEIDDDRAQTCVAALEQKKWNLEEAEEIVLGVAGSPDAPQEVTLLRQVAALEAPKRREVEEAVKALRQAAAQQVRLTGSDAARAREVAAILEQALAIHAAHGDQDCPVCGTGSLTKEWQRRTKAELKRQQEIAREADEAEKAASQARNLARGLLLPAPSLLDRVADLGFKVTDAKMAFKEWSSASGETNLERLADHMDMSWGPLDLALERLKREAEKEIARRESLWRPVAAELASWIQQAKATQGEPNRSSRSRRPSIGSKPPPMTSAMIVSRRSLSGAKEYGACSNSRAQSNSKAST